MQEPLTLNDVVIIRDTAANRHDAVASLRGIVAGISRNSLRELRQSLRRAGRYRISGEAVVRPT